MGKRVHQDDEPRKLEFRMDTDHFINVVTFDESIAVSELFSLIYELTQASGDDGGTNQISILRVMAQIPGQLKQIRTMLSKMVWHEDDYLPPEEAEPIVGLMKLGQIWQAVSGLMEHVGGEAVSHEEESEQVTETG